MWKLILVAALAAPLTGCVVHNHRHGNNGVARRGGNDCGPAHHWNGYKCVHNGNGEGNGKGRGRR